MSGIFRALALWASAKALAAFCVAVLSAVLVVGIVTSDVGELSLSWKLYDIEREGENGPASEE